MKRLLIANRGEIALRIARTAHRMHLETVAIFSDPDASAPHVRAATFAVRVGAGPSRDSYANAQAVLAAARTSGADALHPGYGFLAEDAEFADACAAAGITFVGPSPATMRALGDKSAAKRLLAGAGVPLLPGYDGTDQSDEVLAAEAARLGMPLMIKASAGGGGRGMRLVTRAEAFLASLASARAEALAAFGSADVLLERALLAPRHVEVQIFGDAHGHLVHLGERDCSVQRRHQKLIEETPSPAVDAALRQRLTGAALAVGRAANYENAGTVEFLLDGADDFFFIEVNARLQVEHPVTEAVTGLDLVEWQLRVAAGEPLPLSQDGIRFSGHAIEARLCAEDPDHEFLPQAGTLGRWAPAAGLRIEHALEPGIAVSPHYDSMIAKFVSYDETREAARHALASALRGTIALGVPTNRLALVELLEDVAFVAGAATTALEHAHATSVDVRLVALAGALRYRATLRTAGFGEFAGWSTTARPETTLRLESLAGGGERVLAISGSAEAIVVRLGAESHTIAFESASSARGDESLRASIDGSPWTHVEALLAPDRIELATPLGAAAFTERFEGRGDAAGSAAALDGILRAPTSGRVARIDAVPGAVSRAETGIVVLEAMKMEHHVCLPADVTIAEISTTIGAQVAHGDILLRYDVVAG